MITGICRLCEAVDELHGRHLPHIFCLPDGPARGKSFIQGLIESSDAAFQLGEINRELAGFVLVMLERSADISLFVPRLCAVVDTLVVNER